MATVRLTPATRQQLTSSPSATADIDWNAMLASYKEPSLWRSVYQLVNTAAPFFVMWYIMFRTLDRGYWLTLILAVPTGMFLIRLFVLQHDCGHAAFFKSRRANNTLGFLIGVLTLMPYTYWRKTHAIHHATSGNLDHRDFGDIDTLTVREYLGLSKFRRLLYRLYRHPVVLLVIGPAYQFIFKHRYPADAPRSWKREWNSVHATNMALLLVVVTMWLTIGIDRFLMIQLPVTMISGSIGVFLFYIQHQYEDTYWRYQETWDYYDAGLKGSSYHVLPKVFQWFTGNIGLHHIHHVNFRIPNYYLQRCYDENPELQQVTHLGFWQSVKTLWMTLWDEDERRLIGFRDLKRVRRRRGDSENGIAAIGATKPDVVPRTWR